MKQVSVIGYGNVATHLIAALEQHPEISLEQIYVRDKTKFLNHPLYNRLVDNLSDLTQADLYIISVVDDAVETLSAQLPFSGKLVVHTSGTKPISTIDSKNRQGVFYPLQTFSKNKQVDFSQIPICIEANHPEDEVFLLDLGKILSNQVYVMTSDQRKSLHVAAVFVSNFVNHMYYIGEQICAENQLPFDILRPLILEVADKINYLDPASAQTGPAKRGDAQTISAHLHYLQDNPTQQKIYQLITASIQASNEKL